MRKRKPKYKARRWIASEDRRFRRRVLWGVSFTSLDPFTQTEVARMGFKQSI
jgi:hypothetical protein